MIDYVHEDGAFEPISLGGDGSITFKVEKGELTLIPEGVAPCDESACTLTQNQPEYIFNPHIVLESGWMEVLKSTYIKPAELIMQMTDNPPSSPPASSDTVHWTGSCKWQKSGDHWELYCEDVNLDGDVKLNYWFDPVDDNYTVLPVPPPVDISVKLATEIVFPNGVTFLNGNYVGTKLSLQSANATNANMVLKEADKTESDGSVTPGPPINGVIKLTFENSSGEISKISEHLIIVDKDTSTTNCKIIGPTLEITQSAILGDPKECQIAFKKAGGYTLNFEYEGSAKHTGIIVTKTLTVAKQEEIKATWAPNGPYTWEIFDSTNILLTFSCPSGETSCTDFDDNIFAGATLQMDLSQASGCSIKEGGADLEDGLFTLSAPIPPATASLDFRCIELGNKIFDLAFTDSSSNDFALASGTTQNATIGQMTNNFATEVKINDNGTFANYPLADDREDTPAPTWNNVQALYVGEEYWIVATLSGMPSDEDIEPDSTDKIKMVWPSALDNAMENAKSTCDEKRDINDGVYYLPFERSDDDDEVWIASCKVRFSSTTSLNSSAKISFSLPNSDRINSANKEIALPNGVVEDTVLIDTDFIEGYEKNATTNSYYTLSSPEIKITFDDNHYQARVGDNLTSSMITATINRGSGDEPLDCTKQTDGSFTCLLPDDIAWTDEISIRYDDDGATVFGVTTDDSETFNMVEIPIKIEIASIIWDDSGVERPFPQQMLYHGTSSANKTNSPADSPWYFILDDTYTLRVQIVEDTGDSYAPIVNQGTLKIKFVPGSASEYNKTANSIVDGIADFTLLFNTTNRKAEKGDDYSEFTLTYTGDAFKDDIFTWDTETIHRQNRLSFTEDWDNDHDRVVIAITSSPADPCHDVYLQSQATLICEGSDDCWHLDDPNSDSEKEEMAVYCAEDRSTWIPGNVYHGNADDGPISLNNSINSSSYQIYLWSKEYIGYNQVGWPP